MYNINSKKYEFALSNMKKYQYYHGFHLVTPSPWPLFTAISLLSIVLGSVAFFHSYIMGDYLLPMALLSLIFNLSRWWRDVIIEGTFEGKHTSYVQYGLRLAFILFIVSEIMFFFGFFWAFFHSSLSPSIQIGCIWPPKGITVFKWYEVPLLNTVILLTSGAMVTWAHQGFLLPNPKLQYYPILGQGYFKDFFGYHFEDRIIVFVGLFNTIILGLLFTVMQVYEYVTAPFSISDGIYGSTFFVSTGFHGLHVLVGTIFLIVALFRHFYYHFTKTHHIGFETAAWYWHFVDVVWLFLYLCIYVWGS
jgi:cytochrome c oxidase subunit 3